MGVPLQVLAVARGLLVPGPLDHTSVAALAPPWSAAGTGTCGPGPTTCSIPLREPTPVYTHVLLSRTGDQHPVLTALRDRLRTSGPRTPDDVWVPDWMDR
ncbi:hypothetical protein ACIQM0_12570 [Streptomyces sp. NPDC091387]|uniref:hypothetical protein n=1 Tax=Streptomyces sp. NPDC091387 TaxID=3365998 RepID=UPI0038256CB3